MTLTVSCRNRPTTRSRRRTGKPPANGATTRILRLLTFGWEIVEDDDDKAQTIRDADRSCPMFKVSMPNGDLAREWFRSEDALSLALLSGDGPSQALRMEASLALLLRLNCPGAFSGLI